MADENEIVKIEMTTLGRVQLGEQILAQMEAKGFKAYDYRALELGFELPITWPTDPRLEVTLAQLVVLAQKLDMHVVIIDPIMVAEHKVKDDSKGD